MKKNIGVFITHLQPLNNIHLQAIKEALSEMDELFIILGSDLSNRRTIKNPWTTNERKLMVMSCFSPDQLEKIKIIPIKDYIYNDNMWISLIQKSVCQNKEDAVYYLYGHEKDRSKKYLKQFPKWEFRDINNIILNIGDIDPLEVRKAFFTKNLSFLKQTLPLDVYGFIVENVNQTEYQELCKEFQFIQDYKKQWEKSPYPPVFVTVDAVVIKSGHILVVRRKGFPGKGLYAMPGGFINNNELIVDSCLRELKEETGIALPKDELKKKIVEQKVFDDPIRSLRGRTITHAFCFDLGAGDLPKVKGSDDADKAWWMPFNEFNQQEENFFEDHWHIINYFI